MSWIIPVAGVIGLAVAAYGFISLVIDAVRRKSYWLIVLAVALAAVVVSLLIAFGDTLLQ